MIHPAEGNLLIPDPSCKTQTQNNTDQISDWVYTLRLFSLTDTPRKLGKSRCIGFVYVSNLTVTVVLCTEDEEVKCVCVCVCVCVFVLGGDRGRGTLKSSEGRV